MKCPHNTLAVTIDELALHLHGRAMTQHALDHGRDLRGRAGFELGVDTGGLLVHMPVDHDPATVIADVPFGQEVLIPGTELLRVRGARRGAFTPDVWESHPKDGIDNLGNRVAQLVFLEIAAADIEQVVEALAVLTGADALESRVGAEAIEAQE